MRNDDPFGSADLPGLPRTAPPAASTPTGEGIVPRGWPPQPHKVKLDDDDAPPKPPSGTFAAAKPPSGTFAAPTSGSLRDSEKLRSLPDPVPSRQAPPPGFPAAFSTPSALRGQGPPPLPPRPIDVSSAGTRPQPPMTPTRRPDLPPLPTNARPPTPVLPSGESWSPPSLGGSSGHLEAPRFGDFSPPPLEAVREMAANEPTVSVSLAEAQEHSRGARVKVGKPKRDREVEGNTSRKQLMLVVAFAAVFLGVLFWPQPKKGGTTVPVASTSAAPTEEPSPVASASVAAPPVVPVAAPSETPPPVAAPSETPEETASVTPEETPVAVAPPPKPVAPTFAVKISTSPKSVKAQVYLMREGVKLHQTGAGTVSFSTKTPGTYKLKVMADGYVTSEQSLGVKADRNIAVVLKKVPPPPPPVEHHSAPPPPSYQPPPQTYQPPPPVYRPAPPPSGGYNIPPPRL